MSKTIRVRIAVAVTPNECWNAEGSLLRPEFANIEPRAERDAYIAKCAGQYIFGLHGQGRVVFIEADVPVPDPVPSIGTIEGTVTR